MHPLGMNSVRSSTAVKVPKRWVTPCRLRACSMVAAARWPRGAEDCRGARAEASVRSTARAFDQVADRVGGERAERAADRARGAEPRDGDELRQVAPRQQLRTLRQPVA